MPMTSDLKSLAPAAERIAEWRRKAGREGRTEITFTPPIGSGEEVARLEGAGVDRVFVKPWERGAEAIEALEDFAARHIAAPDAGDARAL